ncbi:hypothetical protein PIB30_084839 [Stylosanthes scabra]|uniref:Uncharacterized protein n=1 Tax=Stylosanthes scabra TaxID=79078 RepID=A0ABU6VWD2_9FABA|nr:hypothetical protein [Stylosanthes scabra]
MVVVVTEEDEIEGDVDFREIDHSVNSVARLDMLCKPVTTASFHQSQPRTYLAATPTTPESSWYAYSGASLHVTTEHSNIMQHSDSHQGPEQLYVSNGKRVTKELLLKGKAERGIYSFDNLVISRISQNQHPTMCTHTPVSTLRQIRKIATAY